jgi:hypothetical protein
MIVNEERVFWQETFLAKTLDFRSRINFIRFDACTFINCTLLIDDETEQLAFTDSVFQDCNIDHLDADDARSIRAENNRFERPIESRRLDFEKKLEDALDARSLNNRQTPPPSVDKLCRATSSLARPSRPRFKS